MSWIEHPKPEVAGSEYGREALHSSLVRNRGQLGMYAAFYTFPAAPSGMTANDFVTKAIENNVLIIPGNVFSERDTHFRISYATTDEKLAQGCDILSSLVR